MTECRVSDVEGVTECEKRVRRDHKTKTEGQWWSETAVLLRTDTEQHWDVLCRCGLLNIYVRLLQHGMQTLFDTF